MERRTGDIVLYGVSGLEVGDGCGVCGLLWLTEAAESSGPSEAQFLKVRKVLGWRGLEEVQVLKPGNSERPGQRGCGAQGVYLRQEGSLGSLHTARVTPRCHRSFSASGKLRSCALCTAKVML